ncbi:hypothetical protein FRC02_006903 [Tulasnella sp. 418]|nr:hypothetical protein FRC02_006903 [Tulasnella sp. 418]
MSLEPRHQFYETDEKVNLSVMIKEVDADKVNITITPHSAKFEYNEWKLNLEPLKAEVDPEQSGYRVGKVKVEIWLVKKVLGRWGNLVREDDEPKAPIASSSAPLQDKPLPKHKNWEKLADTALSSEKEKTLSEDPNTGGDAALNSFFQQIYAGADEDTKRAMMKSFVESGGTALSTNWDEVGKGKVEVKPPSGSEYKKWAA